MVENSRGDISLTASCSSHDAVGDLIKSVEDSQTHLTNKFAVHDGKIERSGLYTLSSGLVLARAYNIRTSINGVEYNSTFERSADWYLKAFLCDDTVEAAFDSFIAYIFLDGRIELAVSGGTGTDCLADLFNESSERCNIVCRSVRDIPFAIMFIRHQCGDSDNYLKNLTAIETLLKETAFDKARKTLDTYTYKDRIGRVPVKKLTDSIRELGDMYRELRSRFNGDEMPVFSIKEDGSSAKFAFEKQRQRLFEIKLDLSPMRGVDVSYRIDPCVLAEPLSVEWVKNEAFCGITYTDELYEAVCRIYERVSRLPVFHNILHVIACTEGDLRSEDTRYIVSVGGTLSTADNAGLNKAVSTHVLTGVGLRTAKTAEDGVYGYEILPGRDRYGKPLSKVTFCKERTAITRRFSFYDSVRGEFHEVYADIVLSDFTSAKSRRYTVKPGVRRPYEMLSEILNVESLPSVKSLAVNLFALSRRLGLDNIERVVLVQMFVQSLKYVTLADDLQKNRSAVEVLLDGCGNCLEKSALEAQILLFMGYSSAVMFRYARNMKTMFHSVCGVGFSWASVSHNCFFDPDSDPYYYSSCKAFGYIGSEVTRGRNIKLGCALDWSDGQFDAVCGVRQERFYQEQLNELKNERNPGQVAVLELKLENDCVYCSEMPIYSLFGEGAFIDWAVVEGWFA